MGTRRVLPWVLGLELAAIAATRAPSPAPSGAPARGAPELAGEACVDCHAAIVESYRETGMARALGPLERGEAERLARLDEVRETATGYRYRFDASGERASIVESWAPAGAVSKPVDVGSAPLAFAIGAGLMDRSFAAVRGGMLWFAPLEVLGADEGLHAALAPGNERLSGTRLEQGITNECLACHTEALPPETYPLNAAPPPAWVPRGIGCAACHGDVSGHVAWREEDLSGAKPEGADPVLASAGLDRTQRISICARCHLQGDARLALQAGARAPPRPGGDLLARLAVFVAGEPTEDIGFVSQVERLVLSRCFVESAGREKELACETCHDPHRSAFEPAERAKVRAACRTCHPGDGMDARAHLASACSRERAPEDAARDCASCHMRRTSVFDLRGIEIHDHFIRARPPPPSRFETLRAKQSRGPSLARFAWPGAPAPPLAGDPGLQMMALAAAEQPEAALALAGARPAEAVFRLPMYHHLRGSLLEQAGRLEDARVAYERALVLDPELAESEVNLGLVLARLGRGAPALARLGDVLRRFPDAEGAWRNRSLAHALLGNRAAARADLEAAHAILPRAENARALAELSQAEGDASRAQAWRDEARRLAPER